MVPVVWLVAAAAILWGANFPLSQIVLADMHPLAAGAGRFALAAVVMGAMAVAAGQTIPLRRHARAFGVLGIVGVSGFNLLFMWAMTMTSAVNASLIMATNPLVTALLAAALLGERLHWRQMAALPVALAGVGAVILGRPGAAMTVSPGDGLMLAANLCWAAYNVLGRRLMPAGPALANAAAIMVVGAVTLGGATVAAGIPVALPGASAAGALVAMGLGGTVMAYLFWNKGLAALGAARTSLFLNLVPVSAMTIEGLLGRPPGPLQVAGALVVLGAVSAASLQPPMKRSAKTNGSASGLPK